MVIEPEGRQDGADPANEDRAAARAFLQRSEVRLSTVHRVASALLSGAGLMVLLPAVERDSVVGVLRPLVTGTLDGAHLLLAVAVVASLALPFTALWLVVRDLTLFYFHANHLGHDAGEAFAPRFTLTGLQLPGDELSPSGTEALDAARRSPQVTELLVPANEAARRRIDAQVSAYGGLGTGASSDDHDRAAALFALAAARRRGLLEEVAKVEHGLVRHVLTIQVIVLRYVKALLALLATAFSAFACAAVVNGQSTVDAGEEAWIAAILLVWAPLAITSVTSPVRWLERQLRNEGATSGTLTDDPELSRVELATVRLALVGYTAAALAMLLVLDRSHLGATGDLAGMAVIATSAIAVVLAIRSSGQRLLLRKILAPS